MPRALAQEKAVPLATVRCGDPAITRDLLSVDGLLRGGHFSLLSGLHTDSFIAFSTLARDADSLRTIGGWLAPTVVSWGPDVILAPTTVGVSLAGELARQVQARLELALVDDEGRPIEVFGGDLSGARVVVANDVVTTGMGLRLLCDLARDSGATVVGAAWFVSRGMVDTRELLGVPDAHAADLNLAAWPGDTCPLCSDAIPAERAVDLN